jgi:hypothetical protein
VTDNFTAIDVQRFHLNPVSIFFLLVTFSFVMESMEETIEEVKGYMK